MNRERTDLDIPEETVWPATSSRGQHAEAEAPGAPTEGAPAEAAPTEGTAAAGAPLTHAQPVSLDPDRDDAERNAAAGGWDGANEQIENDFEAEQLRRAQAEPANEDVPLT